MEMAAENSSCFTMGPGLTAKYLTNLHFTSESGKKYLHVMKERFRSYEPVLYMTRHHPLLPIFREKIKQLVESGWVYHQAQNLLNFAMRHRRTQSKIRNFAEEDEDKRELSLDAVAGVFIFPGIVLVLAFLVFLYELLYGFSLSGTHKGKGENVKGRAFLRKRFQ